MIKIELVSQFRSLPRRRPGPGMLRMIRRIDESRQREWLSVLKLKTTKDFTQMRNEEIKGTGYDQKLTWNQIHFSQLRWAGMCYKNTYVV